MASASPTISQELADLVAKEFPEVLEGMPEIEQAVPEVEQEGLHVEHAVPEVAQDVPDVVPEPPSKRLRGRDLLLVFFSSFAPAKTVCYLTFFLGFFGFALNSAGFVLSLTCSRR